MSTKNNQSVKQALFDLLGEAPRGWSKFIEFSDDGPRWLTAEKKPEGALGTTWSEYRPWFESAQVKWAKIEVARADEEAKRADNDFLSSIGVQLDFSNLDAAIDLAEAEVKAAKKGLRQAEHQASLVDTAVAKINERLTTYRQRDITASKTACELIAQMEKQVVDLRAHRSTLLAPYAWVKESHLPTTAVEKAPETAPAVNTTAAPTPKAKKNEPEETEVKFEFLTAAQAAERCPRDLLKWVSENFRGCPAIGREKDDYVKFSIIMEWLIENGKTAGRKPIEIQAAVTLVRRSKNAAYAADKAAAQERAAEKAALAAAGKPAATEEAPAKQDDQVVYSSTWNDEQILAGILDQQAALSRQDKGAGNGKKKGGKK